MSKSPGEVGDGRVERGWDSGDDLGPLLLLEALGSPTFRGFGSGDFLVKSCVTKLNVKLSSRRECMFIHSSARGVDSENILGTSSVPQFNLLAFISHFVLFRLLELKINIFRWGLAFHGPMKDSVRADLPRRHLALCVCIHEEAGYGVRFHIRPVTGVPHFLGLHGKAGKRGPLTPVF